MLVYDSHYGQEIETEVLEIRGFSNMGPLKAGIDKTNNLIMIEERNGRMEFINSQSFGSLKHGEVTGWCFDREGVTSYDEEGNQIPSSGYYAPTPSELAIEKSIAKTSEELDKHFESMEGVSIAAFQRNVIGVQQ